MSEVRRSQQQDADAGDALRAYDAAERHFAQQEHLEVVLLGADSLSTLRRTHTNAFDGTGSGWAERRPESVTSGSWPGTVPTSMTSK